MESGLKGEQATEKAALISAAMNKWPWDISQGRAAVRLKNWLIQMSLYITGTTR